MFIGRANHRRAFTLLEIMLAVGILAMMALAIYRFVQTNMVALRVSSEMNSLNMQYAGFANLVSSEWQRLPGGHGAMSGEALKLNDCERDEISWTTTAGPGLLTRYAAGEYLVTLKMRSVPKQNDRMELGIERQRKSDNESENNGSWVTLLPDVRSLEIHYFDPRLNTWLDKWTDTITLPRLVKLTIGRPNESLPWETIIALGRTPL